MYHRRTVVNPFGHVMSCHVKLCRVELWLLWVGRVNIQEQTGKKRTGRKRYFVWWVSGRHQKKIRNTDNNTIGKLWLLVLVHLRVGFDLCFLSSSSSIITIDSFSSTLPCHHHDTRYDWHTNHWNRNSECNIAEKNLSMKIRLPLHGGKQCRPQPWSNRKYSQRRTIEQRWCWQYLQ